MSDFDKDFEETDFSEQIKKGKKLKTKGRPRIGTKVSLILQDDLITKLKEIGEKKGIGYQTMARMIIAEKISEYEDTAS